MCMTVCDVSDIETNSPHKVFGSEDVMSEDYSEAGFRTAVRFAPIREGTTITDF